MVSRATQPPRRLDRAAWLGSWSTPAVGVAIEALSASGLDGDVAGQLLTALLATLFVCLIIRLVLAAAADRRRRSALVTLAIGLIFWALGSAALNASGQSAAVSFPAPGEWLFLVAYAGFSGYLLMDRTESSGASLGSWLDATIVCGGTACLAGFALVTPLAAQFSKQGVPLLVVLFYPLLDVALLILVVGQIALRQRALSRASVRLLIGLLVLAAADASLMASLSSGTYQTATLVAVAWALAFLLLVGSACGSAGGPPATASQKSTGRGGSLPVLAAATVALAALTVQPPPGPRPFVVVPAVVTLVTAGLRLVLALRQAREAAEAYRLSRTDDLTGLPNRRALNARLAHSLASYEPVGLLLLDLDGFKEVNDTLGHAAGDTILKAIGARVGVALGSGALAVRLGGDEFAVVLRQNDPSRLLEQAELLRDAVRKPVRVDGLELSLDSSVGIAVRAQDDTRGGDLLRRADIAMYQAKAGRSGALVYDPDRDEFSRERLRIAEDLRQAIDRGQLEVWYQPKVSTATGRPCGVEALLRWRHPEQGLLLPGAFLPAARRGGLMAALTNVVLDHVVDDACAWRATGLDLQVAVNVAPPELLAARVMEGLFRRVRESGLSPGALIVEVTEDSFLADPEHARLVIEAIRSEGMEVSIDDYGTGFSSLSYLRDLPIQELKIDRSFVVDVLENPRNHMIVRRTNEMAQGLGLRTVAEGVEDEATVAELSALGLDVLQGYHFSRPLPAAQVADWIAGRTVSRDTLAHSTL